LTATLSCSQRNYAVSISGNGCSFAEEIYQWVNEILIVWSRIGRVVVEKIMFGHKIIATVSTQKRWYTWPKNRVVKGGL
jgi:hypothetical protein